jgi:hypothetical protein
LEKGDPLHLNKLESPPPKVDLCQVWLKLARWFLRRSPYGIAVDTAKAVDTAIALQFYFMSTAKMQ